MGNLPPKVSKVNRRQRRPVKKQVQFEGHVPEPPEDDDRMSEESQTLPPYWELHPDSHTGLTVTYSGKPVFSVLPSVELHKLQGIDRDGYDAEPGDEWYFDQSKQTAKKYGVVTPFTFSPFSLSFFNLP